jgi:hypothetical protein
VGAGASGGIRAGVPAHLESLTKIGLCVLCTTSVLSALKN